MRIEAGRGGPELGDRDALAPLLGKLLEAALATALAGVHAGSGLFDLACPRLPCGRACATQSPRVRWPSPPLGIGRRVRLTRARGGRRRGGGQREREREEREREREREREDRGEERRGMRERGREVRETRGGE
ncbi:hypothetical protein U1Q18_051591 [Sarracenia purpurea var. burkii]